VYPSGAQFEIRHGEHRATIVEVGAGIREYAHAGVPVLEPYPLGAMCDGGHGVPLIPGPTAWRRAATASTVPSISWR